MGARRYAVIGLGAVGGLYGARLQAAGHEVHFVVRSDADHVRQHGIDLRSVYGDVRLDEVSVFTDPAEVPEVDAVIVALKTTANDALARLLPPLVHDDSLVLVLQNGLGVEAEAARAARTGTVVGGMAFVCSNRLGPGQIHHMDYGAVSLAEYRPDGEPAGITPAVEALASDLEAAHVEVRPQPDLVSARWRKLVWNIPYNGLSVVLDAGTDELMADDVTRTLVEDLMGDVLAGAAADGGSIEPEFVDTMLGYTDEMTPYRTSMKLDYDEGRPLELEAIYHRPIEAARAGGVELPRVEALYRQLRFLDQRNQAEDDLRPTLGP
jgi:2-dehydropantoate 2-reductase